MDVSLEDANKLYEYSRKAVYKFLYNIDVSVPIKSSPLAQNVCAITITFSIIIAIWFLYNYYTAYTLSKNCKVIFNWTDEPKKVGDTVGFLVIFYQLDGTTHDEHTLLELVQKVSISIRVKKGEMVPHKLKPYLDEDKCLLMAEFEVSTAGVYEISLILEGFIISGSPFNKTFFPGVPDPARSSVVKSPQNLVVATVWKDMSLEITMADKNGNKCRVDDIELDAFHLSASLSEDKPSRADEDVIQDFIYSFLREDLEGHKRITLNMKMKKPGVFNIRILYSNCLLTNGFFTTVVVEADEEKLLDQVLKCEEGKVCYPNVKAKLLATGSENLENTIDVMVGVTPKNLIIQQIYWNILTSQLFTFAILSRTKIRMISSTEKEEVYIFEISDGIQRSAQLKMGASEARIILILFAHFMSVKTGRMIYFEDKEKFFYSNLAKSLPESRFCFHIVQVSRKDIIKASHSETKFFTIDDWRKSFQVSFIGENVGGIDSVKDWLCTCCDAIFDDDRGNSMFTSMGNSRLVHPNHSLFRSKRFSVQHYEFAGKIIGKFLLEASVNENFKGMILARFSRSFLAQLIGIVPSYKHFELDNPDLYHGTVKTILESDLTTSNLKFTEPVYDKSGSFVKNVDIIPRGSIRNVSNDCKEEYLNALACHQLKHKVSEEIDAFRMGLHSLVPEDLLAIFDENELELLMCGNAKFDLSDLKKNYVTGGSLSWIPHQNRIIEWFWKAIDKMSPEERSRLLQFTTGNCLLPRNGFKALKPKFKICISSSMNQLPVANKHLHQITVSDHYTFEEFEEALIFAINQNHSRD